MDEWASLSCPGCLLILPGLLQWSSSTTWMPLVVVLEPLSVSRSCAPGLWGSFRRCCGDVAFVSPLSCRCALPCVRTGGGLYAGQLVWQAAIVWGVLVFHDTLPPGHVKCGLVVSEEPSYLPFPLTVCMLLRYAACGGPSWLVPGLVVHDGIHRGHLRLSEVIGLPPSTVSAGWCVHGSFW